MISNKIRGKLTRLVQVDDIQLLPRDTVEHPALLIQENNFHGLEFLGELPGSNVRIDIEDLTVHCLCEACQNGECACSDGSFDRPLIDFGDSTDKAVFSLVKIVCGEDTGCDGTGTGPKSFEGTDKFEIFLQKDFTSDVERFGVCSVC